MARDLELVPARTKEVKGFALTMGKLVLGGHADEVVDAIEANAGHL